VKSTYFLKKKKKLIFVVLSLKHTHAHEKYNDNLIFIFEKDGKNITNLSKGNQVNIPEPG